jgi:phenylacetate-CoA ligase
MLRQRLVRDLVFPAIERVQRRPTLQMLAEAKRTQWWSHDALVALQVRELDRLLTHCWNHNKFHRDRMAACGLEPGAIRGLDDLARLPLLTKDEIRAAGAAIRSDAPPFAAVKKATSGSTGDAFSFEYNVESRHWRDVTRIRAYEWAGYPVGARSLHYWGQRVVTSTRKQRWKATVDHAIKREHYVDSTARGDADLARAIETIRQLAPDVIVTFPQAGADLARFIVRKDIERDWGTIPVICGGERVFAPDRAVLGEVFGPVFETYGGRETMLIGAECEVHDGLHVAMENLIAEIIVREPDGTVRPAAPGETGEVALTDLHNLFMPFIRYLNGDQAVQRAVERCSCGRGLHRIGPVDGRVADTLRDGRGNRVGGLVFEFLFREMIDVARQIQVVQAKQGDITVKLVLNEKRGELPPAKRAMVQSVFDRYLPGVSFTIQVVDDIPLTAGGKRRLVMTEMQ